MVSSKVSSTAIHRSIVGIAQHYHKLQNGTDLLVLLRVKGQLRNNPVVVLHAYGLAVVEITQPCSDHLSLCMKPTFASGIISGATVDRRCGFRLGLSDRTDYYEASSPLLQVVRPTHFTKDNKRRSNDKFLCILTIRA